MNTTDNLATGYEFDLILEHAFDTINDPDGPRSEMLRLMGN